MHGPYFVYLLSQNVPRWDLLAFIEIAGLYRRFASLFICAKRKCYFHPYCFCVIISCFSTFSFTNKKSNIAQTKLDDAADFITICYLADKSTVGKEFSR